MGAMEQTENAAGAVSPYDTSFTVHEACLADPRFSYSLYVPPSALKAGSKTKLIVSIHGTGRQFENTLSSLAEFARWHDCIVLCPLFPAGVLGDRNINGYKYIVENDIRYDLVLIAMVEEIARRYGKDFSKFMLCGFSGGGHFVHRFLLLHPERLSACSIGAPGSVTLIDPARPWWVGTADIPDLFGLSLDIEALQRVPVHMAVGSVDLETWEIVHRPQSRYFMEGANDAGRTRPERLAALKTSFEAVGIACTMELMRGVSHDERHYIQHVQGFFAQIMNGS
jgi:pimeloyl-ACP methyl ester carboxylesterase